MTTKSTQVMEFNDEETAFEFLEELTRKKYFDSYEEAENTFDQINNTYMNLRFKHKEFPEDLELKIIDAIEYIDKALDEYDKIAIDMKEDKEIYWN